MRIAEGAFRFTTEALEKFGGRREVNITVKTVTAGIRGTDLWGKSTSDSQNRVPDRGHDRGYVPGERPFTMDRPLSFYALEGELSRAIATCRRTGSGNGRRKPRRSRAGGVSKRGGKWRIAIATGKYDDALKIYDELRKAGYPAEIVPSKAGEKRVLRRAAVEFRDEGGRRVVADDLKRQAGFRAVRLQSRNVGVRARLARERAVKSCIRECPHAHLLENLNPEQLAAVTLPTRRR